MTNDDFTKATFRRSTFCNPEGGCVEVARGAGGSALRDAKDPGSPVLHFTEAEWQAFVAGVKAGEFD